MHMHRTSVSILLEYAYFYELVAFYCTKSVVCNILSSNNIVLYSRLVCIPLSSYDVVCILCILLLCYAYYYYLVEYRV